MSCADLYALFATSLTGRLSFSALWRKVMVGEPNRSDMVDIIKVCYPSLELISSKIIGRLNKLVSCTTFSHFYMMFQTKKIKLHAS